MGSQACVFGALTGILSALELSPDILMRLAVVCTLFSLTVLLGACDRKAPAIQTDFPLTKLTDRVYVIHGPNEMPTKANQGFMNNPGFVLTRKGVVVIDPGSSVQIGEMLLKKIATVTREPVIAVFNTHIHGDHWLANDAIHRAHPKAVIYAHPKMIEKSVGEGENWLKTLLQLTAGGTKGTKAVIPNLGIDNEETLALGGMHFRIHHTGQAHTDGDLMVEVVEEKVMFMGDNAVVERTGRMDDGNFLGNIAACEVALKTGANHFVPGHGKSNGREVVTAYRDWLKALYGSVKKHYAAGLSDFDMKDRVVADLKPFQKWALFDAEIGKLISFAWLQVEQASF
jgi:glyoxylase-like metal-dependent hydrolase (beta-lactamase superfamily II)